MQATDERRNTLRRLDDLLEALETLNLRDMTNVPPVLQARLVAVGVTDTGTQTVSKLIEQVWMLQQPHLIDLMIDRRRRRRRRTMAAQEAS